MVKVWIGTYDQCFYILTLKMEVGFIKCVMGLLGMQLQILCLLGATALLMLSDKNLLLYRPSLSTFTPIKFELSGQLPWGHHQVVLESVCSWRPTIFLLSGNLPFLQMRKQPAGWQNINLDLPSGFSNNISQHTGTADKILVGDWLRKEILWYDLKTNQYVILKSTSGNPKLGIFQSFYKLDDHHGLLVVSDRIYEWILVLLR